MQESRIEDVHYLKKALIINKEISDAYYYLGIALARNNRSNDAIRILIDRIWEICQEYAKATSTERVVSKRRDYEHTNNMKKQY